VEPVPGTGRVISRACPLMQFTLQRPAHSQSCQHYGARIRVD